MSATLSNRKTRALAFLERLEASAPARVGANLDAFHEDYLELLLGFAFADVMSRDGIDLKTREILTVATLAAMNTGVSREELVEIVLQAAVYAGVPAAMNAITAAKKAFEARS